MDFSTIESIKKAGFEGFRTFAELEKTAYSVVPSVPGVYLVLREHSIPPNLLATCPLYARANFKKKPYPILKLQDRWLNRAIVVYIGTAGSSDKPHRTLRKRINEFVSTGRGQSTEHKGGRALWQLEDCWDLLVCWQPQRGFDPETRESELIDFFLMEYGKLPFANGKRGRKITA